MSSPEVRWFSHHDTNQRFGVSHDEKCVRLYGSHLPPDGIEFPPSVWRAITENHNSGVIEGDTCNFEWKYGDDFLMIGVRPIVGGTYTSLLIPNDVCKKILMEV